jgi:hypothetical protein
LALKYTSYVTPLATRMTWKCTWEGQIA